MTLRIISARDGTRSLYPAGLPEELYGVLAQSLERISGMVHFEPVRMAHSRQDFLYQSVTELQEELFSLEQEYERFETFKSLLNELSALKSSGLDATFDHALSLMPSKVAELYCAQEGVVPLYSSLPPEIVEMIPSCAAEVSDLLQAAVLQEQRLRSTVRAKKIALFSMLIERENKAAAVRELNHVLELKRAYGGANEHD